MVRIFKNILGILKRTLQFSPLPINHTHTHIHHSFFMTSYFKVDIKLMFCQKYLKIETYFHYRCLFFLTIYIVIYWSQETMDLYPKAQADGFYERSAVAHAICLLSPCHSCCPRERQRSIQLNTGAVIEVTQNKTWHQTVLGILAPDLNSQLSFS